MRFNEPRFYAVGPFKHGHFKATINLAQSADNAKGLEYAEADLKTIVKWCLALTDFSWFRVQKVLHSCAIFESDVDGNINKRVHYSEMAIEVIMLRAEDAVAFKERWWNGAAL